MFKKLLYLVAPLLVLLMSPTNANFMNKIPGKDDPNSLHVNIRTIKEARMNQFKALKNFLKASNGASAYLNVKMKIDQRERVVKMTVHRGSATGPVVHEAVLSDYKTEEELHNLFEKFGIEKIYLDENDIQKALDKMKADGEAFYARERERLAKEKKERQLDGAAELRAAVQKSPLVQARKKKLEREEREKAAMKKARNEMSQKGPHEKEEMAKDAVEDISMVDAEKIEQDREDAIMQAMDQAENELLQAAHQATIRADL